MPRTLTLSDRGPAVVAAKRSVFKALGKLGRHPQPTPVFGPFFVIDVKEYQRKAKIKQTGNVDDVTWLALERGGWIDAYSRALIAKDDALRPALVYPVPLGSIATVCQGLHPTAGLTGNWAIDFCSPPGTPILAVEEGKIRKLSGSDPNDDTWDSQGVYGWSVHFETDHGYRYYVTHLGWRASLAVDRRVMVGTVLGRVGDQKHRPDHQHYGVTSPFGERDARKRITAVSQAPRIRVT